MRKIAMTIGMALQGTFAFSSDTIQKEWQVGDDTYKIESQSQYNQAEVNIFRSIVWESCITDKEAIEKFLKEDNVSLEEYKQYIEKLIQFRADQYKKGDMSCLLIRKNNQEIIGGNYYVTEQNGTVVRVTEAGYKLDLDPQILGMAQIYTTSVLSSPTYFPTAQKLVVFLPSGSANAEKIYLLGFRDSDYKFGVNDPEVDPDKYKSYEKPIAS